MSFNCVPENFILGGRAGNGALYCYFDKFLSNCLVSFECLLMFSVGL